MKCCCSNCGWLEINPSGAMFCGYSDERTCENESCLAWKNKDELKTNADRVRTMTDEELAEAFAMISDCMSCNCRNAEDDCSIVDGTCQQQWLKWLQQEV